MRVIHFPVSFNDSYLIVLSCSSFIILTGNIMSQFLLNQLQLLWLFCTVSVFSLSQKMTLHRSLLHLCMKRACHMKGMDFTHSSLLNKLSNVIPLINYPPDSIQYLTLCLGAAFSLSFPAVFTVLLHLATTSLPLTSHPHVTPPSSLHKILHLLPSMFCPSYLRKMTVIFSPSSLEMIGSETVCFPPVFPTFLDSFERGLSR